MASKSLTRLDCILSLRAASLSLMMLGAVALAACDRPPAISGAMAPTVTVVHAVQGDVVDWDDYTGRFEAVQHVDLRPRVGGYIDHVSFAEGQLVHKNDVLFQIDPRPYKAEVERAAAEVNRSRAQRELSVTQLARSERLLQAHAVSQEEFDQRQSERNQAEANLGAAEASLQTAQLNLSYCRVIAPIDGRVSRAEVTAGNYVTAGQTLLTTLVSIDPIYAYFDADEQSYLRYSKGKRGEATQVAVGLADEAGYPHGGRIDFFDNALNPQAGTIRARVVMDNKDGRLTPGLFARIRLSADGAQPVVLVDDRAVNTDQDRRYVLVVDAKNQVAYREIQPGKIADNGLRVVRSGLAVDEEVIVAGAMGVRPGITVDPKEDAAKPALTADAKVAP